MAESWNPPPPVSRRLEEMWACVGRGAAIGGLAALMAGLTTFSITFPPNYPTNWPLLVGFYAVLAGLVGILPGLVCGAVASLLTGWPARWLRVAGAGLALSLSCWPQLILGWGWAGLVGVLTAMAVAATLAPWVVRGELPGVTLR